MLALVGLALLFGVHCGEGDDLLATGTSLYSQFEEELIIRDFFEDRRGGVFVDVGSYHWKDFSTTYYLEKHLGWTGIAVDAQALFAPGYEKNRPGTRFFSYIVTDHSGGVETLYLAGPISTTRREHFQELAEATKNPELIESARHGQPREVQVPTITLNELLDREGISKVDFLSMDIEGSEPAALAGFDIERFRPELVCIEVVPSARDRIVSFFAEHGYERLEAYREHDPVNWYFAPVDR